MVEEEQEKEEEEKGPEEEREEKEEYEENEEEEEEDIVTELAWAGSVKSFYPDCVIARNIKYKWVLKIT